jgi:hypothetical protein
MHTNTYFKAQRNSEPYSASHVAVGYDLDGLVKRHRSKLWPVGTEGVHDTERHDHGVQATKA